MHTHAVDMPSPDATKEVRLMDDSDKHQLRRFDTKEVMEVQQLQGGRDEEITKVQEIGHRSLKEEYEMTDEIKELHRAQQSELTPRIQTTRPLFGNSMILLRTVIIVTMLMFLPHRLPERY